MTWRHIYFDLAVGLEKPIVVPAGTCKTVEDHISRTAKYLEMEIETYEAPPKIQPRWSRTTPPDHIDNKTACEYVFDHNRFVKELYSDLATWSQEPPGADSEIMTPEWAGQWFGLLATFTIPYNRWTQEAYISEMTTLFEVMQTGSFDGIKFFAETLTAEQSAAVIALFEDYLDNHDTRLTLPNNRDYLVTVVSKAWGLGH